MSCSIVVCKLIKVFFIILFVTLHFMLESKSRDTSKKFVQPADYLQSIYRMVEKLYVGATPGSMYNQIVVSVFLYSPFSNIGRCFSLCSSKWRSSSENSHIFAINGSILTLLVSIHSVIKIIYHNLLSI